MSKTVVSLHNLVKRTRDRYREIEAQCDRVREKFSTPCKRGCSGCCYQLVFCTFIEALVIAEHIFRETPERIPELLAKLDADTARLTNRRDYFETKGPCAFLTTEQGPYERECSVYRNRPVACRLEFVVTDPRWCEPDDEHEVARVDMRQDQVMIVNDLACGVELLRIYAPMPPLVAEALRSFTEDRPPIELVLLAWEAWGETVFKEPAKAWQNRIATESMLRRAGLM